MSLRLLGYPDTPHLRFCEINNEILGDKISRICQLPGPLTGNLSEFIEILSESVSEFVSEFYRNIVGILSKFIVTVKMTTFGFRPYFDNISIKFR